MDANVEAGEAVEFVISRVEEQARRENRPLDASEHLLLKNPPQEYFGFASASEIGPVIPNSAMDRIVRLTMCAYEYDETSDKEMELRWKSAAALLKLTRHPLSPLLEAADITPSVELPWWERWLLWSSALAIVVVSLPVAIATNSEMAGVVAFFVLLGIVYMGIRRRGHRHLERAAEKYRQAVSHARQQHQVK